MAFAEINESEIDVRKLEEMVAAADCGAVTSFAGIVRNNARGRETLYLEYSAFLPLAQSQLLKICEDAEARWKVRAAVQHRVGRLEIGEASVAIAVASPHRGESFEACRWIIDTLKADVPIWKKEHCPDGSFWIEGEGALPA